jgi:hypothetical protein
LFEVEINALAPGPKRVQRTDLTEEGVAAAIREVTLARAAFALVGKIDDRSIGDFMFWLVDDRARVRLDLHREWYATDPSVLHELPTAPVTFRDSDGSDYVEPYVNTVARAAALEAFWYWLRTGKMDPKLHWA